jgi:hypothetical protein
MKYLTLSALPLFVACGYSESKFEDDFAAAFCDKATELDCGECIEVTGDTTTTTTMDAADCDYDSKAAKDCVDGEWTCTEITVPGADPIQFVTPPAICADVYDCGTATGSGSDTTAS